jgi:hypothetical protein
VSGRLVEAACEVAEHFGELNHSDLVEHCTL